MTEFERFCEIIKVLRSENGCPWDREQNHGSLKAACIEEACEVVNSINVYEKTGDSDNLKEELGDLLMQVVLHARIAEEAGHFNMEDVCRGISDKMIRRHPHVFDPEKRAEDKLASSVPPVMKDGKILKKWDDIKKAEKERGSRAEDFLPQAFDEAELLIGKARLRKGIIKE